MLALIILAARDPSVTDTAAEWVGLIAVALGILTGFLALLSRVVIRHRGTVDEQRALGRFRRYFPEDTDADQTLSVPAKLGHLKAGLEAALEHQATIRDELLGAVHEATAAADAARGEARAGRDELATHMLEERSYLAERQRLEALHRDEVGRMLTTFAQAIQQNVATMIAGTHPAGGRARTIDLTDDEPGG